MTSSTVDFDGPRINEASGEYRYVAHGERDIGFEVIPEGEGWAVRIDGIPEPSIVHDEPWPKVEDARDAALGAITAMTVLERVQREEMERG